MTERPKNTGRTKAKSDEAGRAARATLASVDDRPKLHKSLTEQKINIGLEFKGNAQNILDDPEFLGMRREVQTPRHPKHSGIADSVAEELNPSIVDAGRAVGGTETSTAKEVNSANALKKHDLIERYQVEAHEPIAVTLAFMSPKDRQAFLDLHYANRTRWAEGRSQEPTPAELRAWADKNFPDRKELILVISDLQHLDKEAYLKVMHWRRRMNEKEKTKLLDQLGLPSKRGKFSKTLATFAPAGGEMFKSMRSGDSNRAANLERRINRARRHVARHSVTK